MSAPHSIIIVIDATGEVTATVEGVSGPACSDISKWLDKLGDVLEDKHTSDWYKKPEQGVTVKA